MIVAGERDGFARRARPARPPPAVTRPTRVSGTPATLRNARTSSCSKCSGSATSSSYSSPLSAAKRSGGMPEPVRRVDGGAGDRHPVELERQGHARRRGEVGRIGAESVAQVDHRPRAVPGEPAARVDPGHRMRERPARLGIGRVAALPGLERGTRAAERTGDPDAVAGAGAGARHRRRGPAQHRDARRSRPGPAERSPPTTRRPTSTAAAPAPVMSGDDVRVARRPPAR